MSFSIASTCWNNTRGGDCLTSQMNMITHFWTCRHCHSQPKAAIGGLLVGSLGSCHLTLKVVVWHIRTCTVTSAELSLERAPEKLAGREGNWCSLTLQAPMLGTTQRSCIWPLPLAETHNVSRREASRLLTRLYSQFPLDCPVAHFGNPDSSVDGRNPVLRLAAAIFLRPTACQRKASFWGRVLFR